MRPSFRLFLFLLLFFGISSRAEAQRIILDGEGDVKIRPLRVNTSSAEEDEIEEEDDAAEAEPLSAQISAHILKLAKVEREKRLKLLIL